MSRTAAGGLGCNGTTLEGSRTPGSAPPPSCSCPSSRRPSQQWPFPSPCLCLSSPPSNRPGLSGRGTGCIFLELGSVLMGPKTGPVTSRGSSPVPLSSVLETPDSTLEFYTRSPGPLTPPRKPPSHQAHPVPRLSLAIPSGS